MSLSLPEDECSSSDIFLSEMSADWKLVKVLILALCVADVCAMGIEQLASCLWGLVLHS